MLRRGLGAGVLGGVLLIGSGADISLMAHLPFSGPRGIEQALIDGLRKAQPPAPRGINAAGGSGMLLAANDAQAGFPGPLAVEGRLPPLDGAVQWINSPPLSREQLHGKVTLVYFWTYSCINCIRTLPYLRAWAEKYKDQGLTVVGVHTPEFAFEKSPENVRRAIANFRIGFPVAVDSDYRIWRAFHNSYWPAAYFVDASGNIRHHQFGEGDYARSERAIQSLLAEAGGRPAVREVVVPDSDGAQAAPDLSNLRSEETYLGYMQADNFASPGGVRQDAPRQYSVGRLRLNQWGLSGRWTVGAEQATLDRADGGITYRFHARDLHLVLGPAADGRAVRFVVTIDGKPPGASMARTSMRPAMVRSRRRVSTSWCARPARSASTPSRSASWIPVPRLMRSPSASVSPAAVLQPLSAIPYRTEPGSGLSPRYAGVWPPSSKPEMDSYGKVGTISSRTSIGDPWAAPLWW